MLRRRIHLRRALASSEMLMPSQLSGTGSDSAQLLSRRLRKRRVNVPKIQANNCEMYYEVDDYTDPWLKQTDTIWLQHGVGRSSRF